MSRETPRSGAPSDASGESVSTALALLARMNQDFAESLDVETTLARALPTMVQSMGAEVGSVWLADGSSGELVCRASVGPKSIVGASASNNESLVAKAVGQNVCQRILDVARDLDFAPVAELGLETRSVLCSPMSVQDRAIGAIEMVNKTSGDGRFSEDDARLLRVLASTAALALANARLTAEVMEHERTQRDLTLAAEIQRKLLPPPQPEPFPVFGVNVPARTVSGDFYDILPLPDDRIGFCLGDVSGKGMNAALLMVKTSSLYRYLARSIPRPCDLLVELDRELSETASHGMFVTLVVGVYHRKSQVVEIANAGHEPALLRLGPGRYDLIPAQAPPLGIGAGVADGAFPEVAFTLSERALYVFSDGLTEACAGHGPLGSQGVQRLIERFDAAPLAERVDAIVSAVAELQVRDDLTMLAIAPEAPA